MTTNVVKNLLEATAALVVALVAIGFLWEIKQMAYDVQYTKDRVIALEDKLDKRK